MRSRQNGARIPPRIATPRSRTRGHLSPTKFGDLVTADHLVSTADDSQGWEGERFGFVILDGATRWHDCAPSANRTQAEVVRALSEFTGPRARVGTFRSGSAPELLAASAELGWGHESSTPSVSETNAVAERAVRAVVEGARALLSRAHLPLATWPYAVKYFCFALNIRILGGDSAWHRRFQKGHFRGPVIPFGAQVQFLLPKRVQLIQGKWQERAVDGVLLGYNQHSGGRWSGDFIVAELPQPSGGGDVPERPRIFRTAGVHTVKGKPWSFPLSEENLDDKTVMDWQIEEIEDRDGDSD